MKKNPKIITSNVISGHGRGKFLGYPTLNLVIPEKFEYEPGIYAGWVWLDGDKYQGAFHYGSVPTFEQPEYSLEVFVLDVQLAHTPKSIEFEMSDFIRGVMKFGNQAELITQITEDVEKVKTILSSK